MSPLTDFAAVRFGGWTGLPDVSLAGFAELGVDRERPFGGWVGDPVRPAGWFACSSETYRGGLRIWVDVDGAPMLLEGHRPCHPDDTPFAAPDLGVPDARLDTVLGPLTVTGGELVYAGTGLALRVNVSNGVLLGVRGFAPTSVADYVARLRPLLDADLSAGTGMR